MAAQRKEHTEEQMRGLQAYSHMAVCPQCDSRTFKVAETRKTTDAQRRRYVCQTCDFRQTRFDISSETYDELIALRRNFKAMSKIFTAHVVGEALSELSVDTKEIPCYSCNFFNKATGDCSLDIPECDTDEAVDCPSYMKCK
jgi:transcriptional regulator NrdR family protein